MVNPIGAVGAATQTGMVQDIARATGTAKTEPGAGFGDMVSNGLQQVSNLEFTADNAVQDLATGGPSTIEDVMIATSQAQLGVELLAKVRDRALESYQEIMRMQL
jgi:flagellar hook-basal body complex protein FliE